MSAILLVGVCGGVLLLVVLGLFLWMNYNRLVKARNHCDEAWSNIDTELKRRYDLIPNLVRTVKGYATHERELLTQIAGLREQVGNAQNTGNVAQRAEAEGMLGQALGRLMVRVEAYPDLKANTNFLELQHELVNTEDRIQAANRLYNGNVRENNNLVQMFPSNLVAGWFKFEEREYFKVDDAEVYKAMQSAPQIEF